MTQINTAAWIPQWVPNAIFYQIFPERFRNADPSNDPVNTEPWGGKPTRENFFGGDLKGITQGLHHIRDLGANAIYLNPIFKAGTNHRYDTHDYLSIDPVLGTEADFDELVSTSHDLGIRIVLDGVFNHCGLGFGPFQDVVKNGKSSRYRNWFDIYDYPVRTGQTAGTTGFPGYSQPTQEEAVPSSPPNYATCGLAAYLPRLNTANAEVQEYIHKVVLHWLNRGIDGWRLDVPYEIETNVWQKFRNLVKPRFPDAYLVAEEWRNPSPFLHGDTFDGATHYGLRNLILDFLATRALTGEAFLRALHTLQTSLPPGSESGMLTLLGSHDTPRILTQLSNNHRLLELALTCLFTLPGAPLIYYGDEIGLTGADDPECRKTMPWSTAEWNQTTLALIRKLTNLRHQQAVLRHGILRSVWGNDRVAVYERILDDAVAIVILNSSELTRQLKIPVTYPDGTEFIDHLTGRHLQVIDGSLDLEYMKPEQPWILFGAP